MSGRHVLIWIWEREGESNQKRAGRQLWLAPRRRSLSISSGPSDLVGFPLGLAASQLLALLLGLPSSARPPARRRRQQFLTCDFGCPRARALRRILCRLRLCLYYSDLLSLPGQQSQIVFAIAAQPKPPSPQAS